MNVAMRLFADHGYDAVGVQEIVETVGVTKPTLYHYFESKRGLFEAIVEEKSVDLLQMVKQSTAYSHNITASITASVRGYFEYSQAESIFYRMILSAWFAPPSSEYYLPVADLQRRQFLLIENMFQQAAHDHGNMIGRHRQYAVSLKGTIDTYIGVALQGYIMLNESNLVYKIVHQFMHGIFS